MESGRLRIQFQRFGANFADRWPRWTGARLIEVHLHSKSFGGTLKWPLKGGSRLIEVTATAGLTVYKTNLRGLSGRVLDQGGQSCGQHYCRVRTGLKSS